MARHRGCLDEPGLNRQRDRRQPERPWPAAGRRRGGRPAGRGVRPGGRTRQRYEQVQALRAQRQGIKPIVARDRPGQGDRPPLLPSPPPSTSCSPRPGTAGPSLLDDYKPYLHQRWNEGCTNVRQLHAELTRSAATKAATAPSATTSCRSAARHRPARRPRPAQGPRPHQLDPHRPRTTSTTTRRKSSPSARERCPHLDALAGHVTGFAKILTGLHGDRLDDWITAVEADDQPDLHSFARGLKHDHAGRAQRPDHALELRKSSRATSTGSRCSNARPTAAPASPCSASASFSASDPTATRPRPSRNTGQIQIKSS